MAIKRELLLILLLLAVILALVKVIEFFQMNVVEGDASNFVKEDLRTKYPSADIEIMSIVPKYNSNGAKYFELKAKVTKDPLSECPERFHIFYNYPEQNFVPQPPEVIAANCHVCTEGICNIAFPEEAIIASHTMPNTDVVQSFLKTYPDAIPEVKENANNWLVIWASPSANSSYIIGINRNGSVSSVTLGK